MEVLKPQFVDNYVNASEIIAVRSKEKRIQDAGAVPARSTIRKFMKSIYHGTAGANAKLRGKKTRLLSCKCCMLFNLKWEERLKQAEKEIKSL